jgi:hypothetical protein
VVVYTRVPTSGRTATNICCQVRLVDFIARVLGRYNLVARRVVTRAGFGTPSAPSA